MSRRQQQLPLRRVFVAGASGVIGIRLVPELVAVGHRVAAMTRSPSKVEILRRLGAQPVLCDVFDADALRQAFLDFAPDVVVNQLTDLPDDSERIAEYAAANARIRREGTRNLLAAANLAGDALVVAQSVAWDLPGDAGDAVHEHEEAVISARGIVVRYGQLYGLGTYFGSHMPPPPRIHVDEAARRTVPALEAAPGSTIVIMDDPDVVNWSG